MSGDERLAPWHEFIASESKAFDLAQIIAEDAVFHSPVVHRPQEGAVKVLAYLNAAKAVLCNGTFRYVREMIMGDDAMLEFVCEVDGVFINGIDLIHFDAQGRIEDFKVMVRPVQALNKVWEKMAEQLSADVEMKGSPIRQ